MEGSAFFPLFAVPIPNFVLDDRLAVGRSVRKLHHTKNPTSTFVARATRHLVETRIPLFR
jgi:hypothetical protein